MPDSNLWLNFQMPTLEEKMESPEVRELGKIPDIPIDLEAYLDSIAKLSKDRKPNILPRILVGITTLILGGLCFFFFSGLEE